MDAGGYGRFVTARLRHAPPGPTPYEEIAEAAAAAQAADVAVVVVGTSEEVESEGWDRTGLDLPGHQNDLVRKVIAANPRTIVVVNAGAPVLLPGPMRPPPCCGQGWGGASAPPHPSSVADQAVVRKGPVTS